MFSGVDYKTSTDYVIFTLADGTQIKLPTWSAFEALQRLCNETNTNLSALQTIVTALQNNDYITSVDPLTENGKVVGYTIKFAKSNPIVIYNGKDGADGVDGNTPVIGVKKDADGIYYWTLDGEFIVVDGQKIKHREQTVIMARMVQTELRPNSKFERAIGGFPMITERIGRN